MRSNAVTNSIKTLKMVHIFKKIFKKKKRLLGKGTSIGDSQVVLVVKKLPANAEDTGGSVSIPRSGRSTAGGHGNPLQYYCLENAMDRGQRWVRVHRVTNSWTLLRQHSTHTRCFYCLPMLGARILTVVVNWSTAGSDTIQSPT